MKNFKSEYPRPQFVRNTWQSLNGIWNITLNHIQRQCEYKLEFESELKPAQYADTIQVPFCPESSLSGIGNKEFLAGMTYQRDISIPSDWRDMDIHLNCGAVYYKCAVYIDGRLTGCHTGGNVSFMIDLTRFTEPGKTHSLVIVVKNDLFSDEQPSGKQSKTYNSRGCLYTRTTGIWQTIWLEGVDRRALKDIYAVPDLSSKSLVLTPRFHSVTKGQILRVQVLDEGNVVAEEKRKTVEGIPFSIGIPKPKLWSPESPFLYDLILEVLDNNTVIDRVESYFGMREVSIEGNEFLLNGKPFYQRLVLDQGFYSDGIWTSPSDEALKNDIILSKKAGFNGARLHQKVFEERFFYWADKLGYLCWGETASWGSDPNKDGLMHMNVLSELREELVRDRNHPSIAAWTPFNETSHVYNRENHARIHVACYNLCKSVDPSRPVNDSSGYIHYVTDLYTVHNYEQDPNKLKDILRLDSAGKPFRNCPDKDAAYRGEPYIIDEFGGIKWDSKVMESVDEDDPLQKKNQWKSWGYGKDVSSLKEFYHRLEGQVETILSLDHICGYCYTQLTDVEQETNGIYLYDRTSKFDLDKIHKIFSRQPERY